MLVFTPAFSIGIPVPINREVSHGAGKWVRLSDERQRTDTRPVTAHSGPVVWTGQPGRHRRGARQAWLAPGDADMVAPKVSEEARSGRAARVGMCWEGMPLGAYRKLTRGSPTEKFAPHHAQ
jgi:hypothetical protein